MIIGSGVSGAALGWSLVASAALIFANAFFVAYEFAVIAARRSAFEGAAQQGRAAAKAALDAMSDLSFQLAGAQLGITVATVGLGFVAEPAVASIIESWLGESVGEDLRTALGLVVALAIVTFLHLVIGEMIPKNIAIAAAEPTVRWLVLPYRAYLAVVRPFVRLLSAMANAACRLVGVEPRDEIIAAHSAAELAEIVSRASAAGGIEADSADLLHGALHFAQRPVGEIARPLDQVASVRLGATAAQIERQVRESGQTRLAMVARARGEQRIVGYVHAKDLLGLSSDDRFRPLPESLTRQMAVVRADRSLIEVLRVLRRLKRQLAVVVDADGPVGLVSVEEIIRALVEADEPEPAAAS